MECANTDSHNDLPTHSEILKKLSDINDYCEHRLMKGRIRDKALERVRQGWATVTINGFKAYLSVLDGNVNDDEVVRDGIVYVRKIIDEE